jgi:hypothetical protein
LIDRSLHLFLVGPFIISTIPWSIHPFVHLHWPSICPFNCSSNYSSACVSVVCQCLSINSNMCTFVYLLFGLSVHSSIHPPIVCYSIHQFFGPSEVHPPAGLMVNMSTYWCIHSSVHPSTIHLSIVHLSTHQFFGQS